MPFDLSSAKTVEDKSKFDLSSAKIVSVTKSTSISLPAIKPRTFTQRFLGKEGKKTLFGVPEETERVIFPRASKLDVKGFDPTKKTSYQQVAAGTTDLLSLLGRLATSTPTLLPGGEKFTEAVTRTEAPKGANIVRKVAEDITRDPSLIPVMLATAGMYPAAKPATKGLVESGKRILKTGGKAMLAEGVPSSATHQVEEFGETGKVSPKKAVEEIVITGVFASTGRAFDEILAPGLKAMGKKIVTSVIKPSKKLAETVDVDYMLSKNLGGSLDQSYNKINSRIETLAEQLKKELKSTDQKIDLKKAIMEADRYLTGTEEAKAGLGGNLQQIYDELDNLMKEVQMVAPNANVDLYAANQYKRSIGKMGAWNIIDPDKKKNAEKEVANAVYHSLRTAIENAAPDNKKVFAINQELSKLIPIERAIIDRIPVAKRNATINLTDFISTIPVVLNPKMWPVMAASTAQRSPRTGAMLYQRGVRRLAEQPKTTELLTRMAAREYLPERSEWSKKKGD